MLKLNYHIWIYIGFSPTARKWLKIVLRLIYAVAPSRRLILTPAFTKVGGNFAPDSRFYLRRFYNNNIFSSGIMFIIISIIPIISRYPEGFSVLLLEFADNT